MSSALEAAEAYVASLESAPCPHITLAAMHTRFVEALESREEAVSALERKRKQYQASLQSVKLVSARMIQCVGLIWATRSRARTGTLTLPLRNSLFIYCREREAFILSLSSANAPHQ
jgi:hypothetical protein